MNADPNKYIVEQLQTCGNVALKSTCQLFYNMVREDRDSIKAIGSGVLIEYKGQAFLISAAHVLEPLYINKMLVPNGERLLSLNGELCVTKIPIDGSRKDDKIDLAVILLAPDVVQELKKRFLFLTPSQIDLTHKQLSSHQYMVCGYPTSETTIECKDDYKIQPQPFKLRTKISQREDLYIPDYEPNTKWILDYKRTKQKNVALDKQQIGPDPHGVSGGGLWSIPANIKIPPKDTKMKLVGVMTDYFQSGDQVLCATNISLAIAIIEKSFLSHTDSSRLNIDKQ